MEKFKSIHDGYVISLLLATAIGLVLLFGSFWPLGSDYMIYRPIAERLAIGETRLYDEVARQCFLAPWGIVIFFLPFINLPLKYGQAILTVVSLICLVFAVRVVARPTDKLAVILALANLHTFDVIERGNVDAILAAGVMLAYLGISRRNAWMVGWGLWLLVIKPPNTLPIGLFLLFLVMEWKWQKLGIVLTPIITSYLVSLPFLGFDWPLRVIDSFRASPSLTYLQTTLWRSFESFGLPRIAAYLLALPVIGGLCWALWRWRGKLSLDLRFALVLTTTLVITPYALGSHYVLLAPVVVILSQRWKPVLLVWLLTFTPLLRLPYGFGIAWVDMVYPITLAAAAWTIAFKESRQSVLQNASPVQLSK